MIEFEDIILNNPQFLSLKNTEENCNSFLFESQDEEFLLSFSLVFAKFLMCNGENKPCGDCINCKKIELLSHADLCVLPTNHKNILSEDIKFLIENAYLAPLESDKKVFVLNNFSSSNQSVQNKLLKILEEPPKNVYIILNVSNFSKVLPTISSRCKKLVLNTPSGNELEKILKDVPEQNKKAILGVSFGNVTKIKNYSHDEDFLPLYNAVLSCITQLKSSSELLKFSHKLSSFKGKTQQILEFFDCFYRDLLFVKLEKGDLVKNENIIQNLMQVAGEYSADSIDLIIKKIYDIKKQLEFNCSETLLIDNFLLYILEAKFLCNKK